MNNEFDIRKFLIGSITDQEKSDIIANTVVEFLPFINFLTYYINTMENKHYTYLEKEFYNPVMAGNENVRMLIKKDDVLIKSLDYVRNVKELDDYEISYETIILEVKSGHFIGLLDDDLSFALKSVKNRYPYIEEVIYELINYKVNTFNKTGKEMNYNDFLKIILQKDIKNTNKKR